MKIIYENWGVKNYMEEDHRSYRRSFCSWEKKAFCSCVYNCDDLLSYNCLCIVCINVETMTDIFLVVALKVPWPFAVQNQEFPFYDNLYSLQKRKTRPLNFPCFSRDACGIKTKPFVPRELKVWSEKNNKPWYHPSASWPASLYSLLCLLL